MWWWVKKRKCERHDHGSEVIEFCDTWSLVQKQQSSIVLFSDWCMSLACVALRVYSVCVLMCIESTMNVQCTLSSQINFSTQCIATYCYIIRTRKEKPHNDCASEMTWTIITFFLNGWISSPVPVASRFSSDCSHYLTHTDSIRYMVFVLYLWISSSFRLCFSSFFCYHFQFLLHEKLFKSLFPRFLFAVVVVVFLGGN